MNYWIWNTIFVLGISLIISVISYFIFGIKGPWRSFWIKTLILSLFLMVLSFWLRLIGPQWIGVQYISLIMSGLIFVLLLGSMSNINKNQPKIPTRFSMMDRIRLMNQYRKEQSQLFLSANYMFWVLLMLLSSLIILGYYLTEY